MTERIFPYPLPPDANQCLDDDIFATCEGCGGYWPEWYDWQTDNDDALWCKSCDASEFSKLESKMVDAEVERAIDAGREERHGH